MDAAVGRGFVHQRFLRGASSAFRVWALSREAKCYCPVVNNVAQKFGRSVISSGGNFMEKFIVGNPEVCGYGSLCLFLGVSVGCFSGGSALGDGFDWHLLELQTRRSVSFWKTARVTAQMLFLKGIQDD